MAKVTPDDDDILFHGEAFVLRAMRRSNGSSPALEWFDALDNPRKARVAAAFKTYENTLIAKRPPAGRACKVVTSREGLWELRVTKQGGSPPHLRMLFTRIENTLWVAHGFTKQKNALEQKDVDFGDSITQDWKGARAK